MVHRVRSHAQSGRFRHSCLVQSAIPLVHNLYSTSAGNTSNLCALFLTRRPARIALRAQYFQEQHFSILLHSHSFRLPTACDRAHTFASSPPTPQRAQRCLAHRITASRISAGQSTVKATSSSRPTATRSSVLSATESPSSIWSSEKFTASSQLHERA